MRSVGYALHGRMDASKAKKEASGILLKQGGAVGHGKSCSLTNALRIFPSGLFCQFILSASRRGVSPFQSTEALLLSAAERSRVVAGGLGQPGLTTMAMASSGQPVAHTAQPKQRSGSASGTPAAPRRPAAAGFEGLRVFRQTPVRGAAGERRHGFRSADCAFPSLPSGRAVSRAFGGTVPDPGPQGQNRRPPFRQAIWRSGLPARRRITLGPGRKFLSAGLSS